MSLVSLRCILQSYSHLPDRSSSQHNLRKGAHEKEMITKTWQLNDKKTVTKLLCVYRGL